MNRRAAAFIIAPLWGPVIVVPYSRFYVFTYPDQSQWVAFSGILSVIFTYLGVGLIGLPLFKLLKSRNWTSIWIAGAAGFVIGAMMWTVFMAFFAVMLGEGITGIAGEIQDWRRQVAFLWIPGALGTLVGITLWGIARPDRP